MAKTLLGIIASPRKYGNSELFVKELHRRLPGEWNLRLVRLPELDIRPCKACYRCLFEPDGCRIPDDFRLVFDALLEADAYAVAAPVYLLGPNAALKRFLDRGLSFYGQVDRLWGKPAVGVAVAGVEGKEGYTKLAVESFIKLTLGDLRGVEVLYGALPGEIMLGEAGRNAAARLADALVSNPAGLRIDSPPSPDAPVCPACGGDTFRFLGNGRVRCMLCSGSGSFHRQGEGIEIAMEPDDHALFLDYESVVRHAAWLRGMKEQFLARRNELKAVAREYVSTGEWIKRE